MSLPKVVGYSGFQSYGDLPYPSLKAGKTTLDQNDIWQSMNRAKENSATVNNYSRYSSEYNDKLSNTVEPVHYQDVINAKLTKTNSMIKKTIKAVDDPEFPQYQYKEEPSAKEENSQSNLTTSGLMQASAQENKEGKKLPDILKNTFKVENDLYHVNYIPKLNPFNCEYDEFHKTRKELSSTIRPKSLNPNQRIAPRTECSITKKFQVSSKNPENVKQQNGTEHWKSLYTTEMKNDPSSTSNKSQMPKWAIWEKGYHSESLIQKTDYMVNYGELGSKPADLMAKTATSLYKNDDPLLYGTTKISHQIPGYTGHIPRAQNFTKSSEHGRGEQTRTTQFKQNITETYQKRIPGYQGHTPKSVLNDRGSVRPYCFSTQGETYCQHQ